MSEMTPNAEERYRLLVEGAKDYAKILLDPEGCVTSWNAGAERILGWTEEEVLGQPLDLIFTPEDRAAGVPAQELERASVEGKRLDLRWHMSKNGSRFFADGIIEGLRGDDGHLRGYAKVLQDATAGKMAEDERRQAQNALRDSEGALRESEARLRDAQTHLQVALAAGGIATWTFDLTTDRVVADANLASLFSVSPEDAAGGHLAVYLQAIHPEDRPRVANAIADAIAHREFYEAEYRVVLPDGTHRWLATRGRVARDAAGQAVSLPGVVLDITEQSDRRRSERFLAGLAERARALTNPDDVIADAVRSLGEFLGASRVVFADIDFAADACTIPLDYCAGETVVSMAGTFPISAFGPFLVGEYEAGRTVAAEDVRADAAHFPAEYVVAYDAVSVRAFVAAPVLHSARLVSVLAVHSSVPRRWRSEEVMLIQAVVERTWLTVEVLRQQRALVREAKELRAAHERTTNILESITDAFFALDTSWNFTYLNDHAERLLHPREPLLDRNIWEEFPAALGTIFDREYHRAVADQVVVSFEEYYPPPLDTWFEVRAYPSTDGLSVFFHDITARTIQLQREQFLADLAERARALTDPDDVIADAVRSVGEFLGVSRCLFADIDIEADTCSVPTHYRADESVASIAGVFPISAFGAFVVAEYKAGRTAVIDDVRADPTKAPPESLAAYAAIGVCGYVAVPVLHSARLVSALAVHSAEPRHWTPEEITLLQTVVERTWLTVEVTRQNRALVRVAEEQRVRAEREALLNRIGQALRGSADPEQVLDTAVRELAQALGADRCYFTAYDLEADASTVGSEWHRDGLPDLSGRYILSSHLVNQDPVYKAGRTQVVMDMAGDPATLALGLRALVRVPLMSGRAMTALSVAMADSPRNWTAEEVSLVETVATQTQAVLEAVRLQRRERNIAQQLQAALTPSVPEYIPGMALAKYYEAALGEAGVGGDFYDVFPLDKGCTALVVGDLSGKGLAAASQVATVRNMLRYALYRAHTLTGALQSLNSLLVEQGLLTGFATLFVGAYDSGAGKLTYVNCGQEPALIRRSAGLVEPLMPTAPILGSFEGAAFEERTVALGPADTLAMFTDGLTEVGRSRREMLGVEGVADLLAGIVVPEEAASADAVAEYIALQLIAGVDSAAQGGVIRDDVCLLVAVVEG